MPDPQSCHFATQHAMVRPEEMLGSNLIPGRHPPQVTLPELGGGCHSGPLKRRILGRTGMSVSEFALGGDDGRNRGNTGQDESAGPAATSPPAGGCPPGWRTSTAARFPVERALVRDDRRAKMVTLTSAGAPALAAGTTAGEQVLQQIFGSLDQRHLAHLNTLLDTSETGIVKAAQSTAVPSPCAQRP